MFPDDCIGPGRIHDADSFQVRSGDGFSLDALPEAETFPGLPVAEDMHLGGGGGDAFFQIPISQQGVDKGTFSSVKLSHHDK